MLISAISVFVISMILAVVLVPTAGRLASRFGLVDNPDNTRKLHGAAIPLVGGIVVYCVTILVSVAAILWLKIGIPQEDIRQLVALLVASTVILLVGAADDRFNLRGRQKLFGQFLAVSVLILGGYSFESIEFAGVTMPFGVFSIVVVYVWCLAAINSMNLLDGADGFASTVGLIVATSFSFMVFHYGFRVDGLILAALAGALLGFLRHNFPPAKAYLGDAGSMLIGLVVGAVAIRCAFKQAVAYAVFAPVALLAIPFIDTSAAIIRRRLTGRSIYAEDRGHLHHVMARQGLSPVASLIWVAALCSMSAMGAALAIRYAHAEYALVSVVMVVVVMITGKIFGVAEYKLVTRKAKSLVSGMGILAADAPLGRETVQIQGSHDWSASWKEFVGFAQESELNQIMLDVNAPWLHESYHGEWKRSGIKGGASNQWRVELPVVVDGRVMARVVIHAPRDGRFSHHEIVANLLKITSDLESQFSNEEEQGAESKSKLATAPLSIGEDLSTGKVHH